MWKVASLPDSTVDVYRRVPKHVVVLKAGDSFLYYKFITAPPSIITC